MIEQRLVLEEPGLAARLAQRPDPREGYRGRRRAVTMLARMLARVLAAVSLAVGAAVVLCLVVALLPDQPVPQAFLTRLCELWSVSGIGYAATRLYLRWRG